MNQRKAKAARRTTPNNNGKPQEPQAAVQELVQAEGEAQPQQQPPGVLVVRVPGEQPGQERIELAELGGMDPLSVPTLLRIAANIKDQSLGVSERK